MNHVIELAAQYCYLTTTGRTSGQPREIEIWFGLTGHTVYMLSGSGEDERGPKAHWVRNILKQPAVTVRVNEQTYAGVARVVERDTPEDAAARALVVPKYQAGYARDLTNWGKTSLVVAVELVDESRALLQPGVELRLAAVSEGSHTLARVGVVVADRSLSRDVVQRVGEGHLGRVVDGAFEQAHRDLGTIRQFSRQGHGAVHQFARLDHLVDEAKVERLGRRHDLLAHEEVHRLRHAHELDEEELPALIRE